MKLTTKKYFLIIPLALGASACLLLVCSQVFAAETVSAGRRLWDNIMLWVNFGVLAFLFMKYARKPLMDYLRGVQQKVEDNLNATDAEFRDVQSVKASEAERLKYIDERLEEIQRHVIEMGRKEKEEIIQRAKVAAEKMVQDAEIYSKYRLAMAKKALSDEMVDLAVSLVEESLKKGISETDNEKLIGEFVKDLETSKKRIGQNSG